MAPEQQCDADGGDLDGAESGPGGDVRPVLDAIEHLLDAIEEFDAPITRDLLRVAMTALVHECRLKPAGMLN